MKSYLFLFVVIMGLVATLRRPFWGLVCSVAYVYFAPPYEWWGQQFNSLRISLVISLFTLASYLIHRSSIKKPSVPVMTNKLMLLFLGSVVVSASLAVRDVTLVNNFVIENYFKFVILYFLMTAIIQNKREYDYFIWANIAGCIYLGVRAYLGYGWYSFGRLEGIGGIAFRDSEGLATYVCIVLPFMIDYFVAPSHESRWQKLAILFGAPFLVRLLVETQTRAAFVALLVMGLRAVMLFTRMRGSYKYILVLVIGAGGLVYLTDDSFWERMQTITTEAKQFSSDSQESFDQDEEEAPPDFGRKDFWEAGVRMMRDHPLTGVGPTNFQIMTVEYIPGLSRGRAAHNMFVLIGSENGLPGLFILLFIVTSGLRLLHKVRKVKPQDEFALSIYRASIVLELSFVGFLVNGFFINTIYYESFFWLCALIVILYQIFRRNESERHFALYQSGFSNHPQSGIAQTRVADQ